MKINQFGDTILEVLISAAILSLVLVGAFTLSSDSTNKVQNSQEQAEASQALKTQIEYVRQLAMSQTTEADGIFRVAPKYFCISTATPTNPERLDFPATFTLPDLQNDQFNYPADCKNVLSRYNIAVSYDSGDKVFTAVARWDTLGGEKTEQQLKYRVLPAISSLAANPAGPGSAAAEVTDVPCTVDPVTNLCSTLPSTPQYRWRIYYRNISNNPGATVTGCRWEYSDGQVDNDVKCNYNDVIGHTYADPVGVNDYPLRCFDYARTVTLTIYLSNGMSPSNTFTRSVPQCY